MALAADDGVCDVRQAGDKGLLKKERMRRDDRGSAIVIVIIAMAMIGVLATSMLWMAYMNYMIKAADIHNKNSFYTAEEVVEQILTGLRRESAAAVGAAYRETLANWDSLGTENNRFRAFAIAYLDTLIETLKKGADSAHYDRDKLKAYVDAASFSGGDAGVDAVSWDRGAKEGEPAKDPVMELANNNSIILKNIYVACTDDKGRLSIVQTDICLDVPKLTFEKAGSIDVLYDYTLIGGAGVEMMTPGAIKTEGSVYAGTDAAGEGGFQIGKEGTSATKLTMENAGRVVSKGDIALAPGSSLVIQDTSGQDSQVYAQNIILESAKTSLDAKVYVADDLVLNGKGSSAILTKEYYGYGAYHSNFPASLKEGEKIDSAKSSAILINGQDSAVDMTGVRKLLIAGRAYIGVEGAGEKNPADPVAAKAAPVMMGESIAVKGSQIAYLVPAECIGTLDGETVLGQNPISAAAMEDEIKRLQERYGEDFQKVDFREVDFRKAVYRLGGKALRDFCYQKGEDLEGKNDENYFRRVYVQNGDSPLIYYYLVMDARDAERYFVQYYGNHSNKEALDAYFGRYLSGGLLLGDYADPKNQYTISGNSLVSSALSESGVTLLTGIDQSGLKLDPDKPEEGEAPGEEKPGEEKPPADPDAYRETGENAEEVKDIRTEAEVERLIRQIRQAYKGLNYNLTENPAPAAADPEIDPEEAKKHSVFNSVIKETAANPAETVEGYLESLGKNQVLYQTPSKQQAFLSRGDVKLSSLSGVDADQLRLLVCLGDVEVDQNFTGLIIAKGRITVTGGAKIAQDKMGVFNVLEAESQETGGDPRKPIDLFKNGGGSLQNGVETPKVDEAGNLMLDYSELVRYMNWIKK